MILDPEAGPEAMELIRSMIERVVLTPCPSGRGVEARLHGALAGVLAACGGQTHEHPGSFEPGCSLSLVAGARNQRFLRMIEAQIPKFAA